MRITVLDSRGGTSGFARRSSKVCSGKNRAQTVHYNYRGENRVRYRIGETKSRTPRREPRDGLGPPKMQKRSVRECVMDWEE